MLLLLVLVDELNPIVRIYAWRMLLGREGIINDVLQWIGLIDHPLDWLLFTKFSVILVLSTSWVNYTALPIYASMKAINPSLFEAATDLGAGWFTRWRRILIPLGGAGHLRRHHPGLHPAVHRLRHARPRRRHVLVHARQLGRRPHGRPPATGVAAPR